MKTELREIPLNQIHAKNNYRKTFRDKSLQELAASIKKQGVLEPILLRPNNDGFEIIAGERRFRASQLAGKVTIPAIIRDVLDEDVLVMQIVENVQREGVPYMEEAYALQKLRNEKTLDAKELGKLIGKSDAYVYCMIRLCEMSDDARTIAEKGWISKGVAWEISKLPNTDFQTEAANALARTNSTKLITISGAKSYIATQFGDNKRKLSKERVAKFGPGSDYTANWKKYLVAFDEKQFNHFKRIVRGRTETEVWSEAVDLVMREGE